MPTPGSPRSDRHQLSHYELPCVPHPAGKLPHLRLIPAENCSASVPPSPRSGTTRHRCPPPPALHAPDPCLRIPNPGGSRCAIRSRNTRLMSPRLLAAKCSAPPVATVSSPGPVVHAKGAPRHNPHSASGAPVPTCFWLTPSPRGPPGPVPQRMREPHHWRPLVSLFAKTLRRRALSGSPGRSSKSLLTTARILVLGLLLPLPAPPESPHRPNRGERLAQAMRPPRLHPKRDLPPCHGLPSKRSTRRQGSTSRASSRAAP